MQALTYANMRTKVQQVYTPLLYYAQLIHDKSSIMDTKSYETFNAYSYTICIPKGRTRAITFSLVSWFWFRKGVINSILKFIS